MNIYIYTLERNYRKNRTNVCILLLIWYNINCVSFIKDIIYNKALLNNKPGLMKIGIFIIYLMPDVHKSIFKIEKVLAWLLSM